MIQLILVCLSEYSFGIIYYLHQIIFCKLWQVFFTSILDLIPLKHIQQPQLYYKLQQYMQSAIDKIIIYGVPNPQKLKLTQVISNKIKVCTLQFHSSPTSPTPEFMKKIDFEMWAYPDGIKIYNEHFQILNDDQPQFSFFQQNDLLNVVKNSNLTNILQNKELPQSIYSFVLTDYDLNRTYCTCIVWNERYFINDDRADMKESQLDKSNDFRKTFKTPKQHYSLAVPKCSVSTMVNNPLILDANTVLVYVPKVMIVCSKIPCIQLQRALLKYYYENVIMQNRSRVKKTIQIPRIFQEQFNKLVKNYGYPKAQSIFDHEKSSTLRKVQFQLLNSVMKPYDKDKATGIISLQTNKLKQFYLSNLFSIPQDYKQTYIMTENGHKICSKLKSNTVFHLPKVFDLQSEYFESIDKFFPPLIPLPIPQFIQLWKCLLLQKQIIIFSKCQYKSIMLSQYMLYLIQPIKWQNIYIPFLPFHLAHHIDAIGGYLIGMSRIHMDYMLDKFDMKSKVVVDLEYQTILEEGGKEVIQLPQQIRLFIENSLKNILQTYQQSKKPSRSLINYLNLNSQQPSAVKQKLKFKQNFVIFSLQIQKVFFHALVCLFNNFIPFISRKQDGIISVRTEDYLDILPDKLHRTFMKEISKTMVFIRLCEYHVEQSERCAWVQKTIGELFVYSHDILSHKFLVSDQEGSSKKLVDFSSSNKKANTLQINSKQQNKVQEEKQKVQERLNDSSIRAYAWKMSDLLKKQQKYCQYIQYLFDKNLKQITHTAVIIEEYIGAEQKKYSILMSQDQFQSFEQLQSIKIPANFGKKDDKQKQDNISKRERQKQQKIIYEQLYNQQSIKSKKWKKYGERDQQDLYEEMAKICSETKVQKLLIKYLKYIELNYPQAMIKVSKKSKKPKKKAGMLNWLWDLVNPPDVSRVKQQSEIKSSLQKKNANKMAKQVINLNLLFGERNKSNEYDQHIQKEQKKKDKENKNKKQPIAQTPPKKNENGNQNIAAQKIIQSFLQNTKKISRTQSDVVKFTTDNQQQNSGI